MTEHGVDNLHEYVLNTLEATEAEHVREHLRGCRGCVLALGTISDLISDAVVSDVVVSDQSVSDQVVSDAIVKPMQLTDFSSARSRLLDQITALGPYSLYRDEMAAILGGSKEALAQELEAMPHPDTWMDGPIPRCRLYGCTAAAGPRDAIRTLVLMESGSHFPKHEHLGDETVLILQGTLLHEDGKIYRPGAVLRMAKGTSHAFDVPEGLDLI